MESDQPAGISEKIYRMEGKGGKMSKSCVDIGLRQELFIDNWFIEEMQNSKLTLNRPQKKEVVLTFEKPWEGPASGCVTAIRDTDEIKLYYRGHCTGKDTSADQVTCVVTSKDGVHFQRPDLGLFLFNGSIHNNILWMGKESHNFAPMKDNNPDACEKMKYKAVGGPFDDVANKGALYGMCSRDGIHWTKLQEEALTTRGWFDSLNIVFWDESCKCYRMYSRYFSGSIRAIQSSVSKDFIHWEDSVYNRYDCPLEDLYTNATVLCPGAEHLFLAFPKRFVPNRKKIPDHEHTGLSEAVFMSSRDGIHWDRPFMEAWVYPGPDERNWTDRSNMPAFGIIDMGDEFAMYISEHYRWEDSRLRRLTIPRHRFASVYAGYDGGSMLTRPFIAEGSKLVFNYATSVAGHMKVEIQHPNGEPVEGFSGGDVLPAYGDCLEEEIRWASGKSYAELAGMPIRMKLELKDAHAYAFRQIGV